MPVDPMFIVATLAFAWGLSLATYRLFAVYNGWPMGEWQAHRPGLPIAIGLFAVLFAMLFALARGGTTVLIVPLFGVLCALAWTALTRIGAQSALLLAPLAVMALLLMWIAAASSTYSSAATTPTYAGPSPAAGATLPRAETPVPTYTIPAATPEPSPSLLERTISDPPVVLPPLAEPARGIPTDRQPSLLQPPQGPSPQR